MSDGLKDYHYAWERGKSKKAQGGRFDLRCKDVMARLHQQAAYSRVAAFDDQGLCRPVGHDVVRL